MYLNKDNLKNVLILKLNCWFIDFFLLIKNIFFITQISINKPHPLFEANQENSTALFTTRVNLGKEQGDQV